jgi:hypothetical protein
MIIIGQVWHNDFGSLLTQLEENLPRVKHIVFDFLLEIRYIFYPNKDAYYKMIDLAYENDIPVTILTPYDREAEPLLDFSQPKFARIKMIHWETFWFKRTYNAWTEPYKIKINSNKNLDIQRIDNGREFDDFKYPYITLNNISKLHRSLMMDLLAKHNLIDVGAIAWRDINHACDDVRHTFPEGMTDSMYLEYPYKYWKPKRMILDMDIDEIFNQETLPVEFNQSFMQLVVESDSDITFFSEKTATPILLNKPFLVASNQNFHSRLRSFGFVNYDELFDYSFDSESDIALRYEGLVENVKRYSSFDKHQLKKLHDSIFDKLLYNKQQAMNIVNNIPPEIAEIVDYLKQENVRDYTGPLNIFL